MYVHVKQLQCVCVRVCVCVWPRPLINCDLVACVRIDLCQVNHGTLTVLNHTVYQQTKAGLQHLLCLSVLAGLLSPTVHKALYTLYLSLIHI